MPGIVSCDYRFNLLHESIVIILLINAAEQGISDNISIPVYQDRSGKCHDICGLLADI